MAGFYSANEHRSYPLVDADVGVPVPDAVLVDFGCIVGLRAGYEDGVHSVWLARIARSGTAYTFDFASDAPGLADRVLRFTRDLAAAEYATEWAEDGPLTGISSSSSLTDASGECVDDPLVEGFLVTGLLAELPGLIADGDELTGPVPVEPALVQNLARSAVRSVNLGNKERVRVDPADGCNTETTSSSSLASSVALPPLVTPPFVPDPILVNAACLIGALQLKEDFNCSIRVNAGDNSVTIGGQVGAGEGEPCDEVPLYADEAKPAGSALLTGGPACTEVLKSINGIGGRVVRLVAGDGVKIAPGVEPNVLVLDVDLHGMALCVQPVVSSISASTPTVSSSRSSSSSSPTEEVP